MQKREFLEEIKRLGEVYGQTKYPTPRALIFYKELSHVPIELFKKAVDTLISTKTHAPMMNEIQEAVRFLRPTIETYASEASGSSLTCFKCQGLGSYSTPGKTPGEAAWRWQCTQCETGRTKWNHYPAEY